MRTVLAFYTTKNGGMGIGLSVSRSIIESHNGRLWAAPNDGPGTTFSFSITLKREVVAGARRREREVMALVVSGLLNKQVGGELGISEITVKSHRGKVMEKMKADSLADLVIMAARLRPALLPKT
jgi:DNA-binding NarL/FixJ family response regulator